MNRKEETKWFKALKDVESDFRVLISAYGVEHLLDEMERGKEIYGTDSLVLAGIDYVTHLKHLVNVESSKMVFDTRPNPVEGILLRMNDNEQRSE